MGGKVFRDAFGDPTVAMIRRENVSQALDSFKRDYLSQLGVTECYGIGSTDSRSTVKLLGDLDVVIGCGDLDAKYFKQEVFEYLSECLGHDQVKKVGSIVSVRYPIGGTQINEYAQIDVMTSQDPSGTAWLMSGGQVKGVFRNLLLNLIAKNRSMQITEEVGEEVKISIAYPGGMTIRRAGRPILENRITCPRHMMKVLRIKSQPEDVRTFTGLVDYCVRDPKIKPVLREFSDRVTGATGMNYIADYESKMPREALRATNYINESLLRTS